MIAQARPANHSEELSPQSDNQLKSALEPICTREHAHVLGCHPWVSSTKVRKVMSARNLCHPGCHLQDWLSAGWRPTLSSDIDFQASTGGNPHKQILTTSRIFFYRLCKATKQKDQRSDCSLRYRESIAHSTQRAVWLFETRSFPLQEDLPTTYWQKDVLLWIKQIKKFSIFLYGLLCIVMYGI